MLNAPRHAQPHLFRFRAVRPVLLLAAALALLANGSARGQLPTAVLTSVFPPGGKIGTTVDLTLTGSDIDDANALIFSNPGITAVQKSGADNRLDKAPHPLPRQFTATISGSVPTGMYEVRAVGKYGISNPRGFVVGNLNEVDGRQTGASPAAAKEVPLESSVNGQATGERADFFRFPAKKGQRVLVDCWAHRLDSKMDPAIVLLDGSGHEVARAKERQHRDLLLDYAVPADGPYVVKLYDFLYKGGGDYFYRVDVSTAPLVDFIMPPAGLAGTKGRYTVYGRNLPNSIPSELKTADGKPLDRLDVEIQLPSDPISQQQLPINSIVEPSESFLDAFAYRLPTPRGDANPVDIFYATAPVVAEQEPNDTPSQAQKISPPCEVVGQFNPRGDQDWYTFDAKKGDVYWIEVYSQRMGLTTDPYLLVQRVKRNAKGAEEASDLAEVDDPPATNRHERVETRFDLSTNDPWLRFTAPEDGVYRLLVRDLYYESRGNPRFVYRLAVRREAPDFRLVAVCEPPLDTENPNHIPVWTPLLHKGGTSGVTVIAERRDNFAGEIQISAEGLPEGVACAGTTLGPGVDVGTLVFTAAEKIAPWNGTLRVIGKAKINGAEVLREARAGAILWPVEAFERDPLRLRLCAQLPLAVSGGEAIGATVQLGDGKPLETAIGGKLQIPVKVTRHGDFKGSLKLFPAGVPREMKIPELNIAGGANDGNLQVDIRNGVPAGDYTFVCRVATRINYRHNPEAAAAAADAAKAMEKLAAEAAAAAKKAADEKIAADKAAADAAAAAKQAADALPNAAKALADTQAKLKAAQDAKAAAQKTTDEAAAKVADALKAKEYAGKLPAESDPAKAKAQADVKQATEDAAKQATDKSGQAAMQLAAANRAVKDVDAAVAAATMAKLSAEKIAADAAAKAKTTADAKPAADAAANAAAEKSKVAEAEKQVAAERARQANDKAQPRETVVVFYSTPIAVKIAATPIVLAIAAPSDPVKPGDKLELPLTLNRLYGFNDSVTVGLADANAAPGLHVSEVSIPGGQTQAKLIVQLDPKISLGDHPFTVRTRLNFNGQPLQADQPVTLKVAIPPPEKKPEPAKTPEPAKQTEPEKKPEAEKKPQPEKKPDGGKKLDADKKPATPDNDKK